MDIKRGVALTLASILAAGHPTLIHAANCIRGKPCGKGCISPDKNCRITASPVSSTSPISNDDKVLRYDPSAQPGAIIHRSEHRLPRIAVVRTDKVNAKQSPTSNTTTRRYKQGQKVFVYETTDSWARISNMQPDEWVKLEALRLK